MKIYRVCVENKGIYYACEPTDIGWRCGNCMREFFSSIPKKGDVCRLCNSAVVDVIWLWEDGIGRWSRAHPEAAVS